MTTSRSELREGWARERGEAKVARRRGDVDVEWRHLERAHVLSQPLAGPHVRTHVAMLGFGLRHRDTREIVGQLIRLVVAAPGTWTGRYPVGNTGGANVAARKPMPIPDDLQALLRTNPSAPRRPMILAVEGNEASRDTLRVALDARYGHDYEVVVESSPLAALDRLRAAAEVGTDVAVVLADQWTIEMPGTDLLAEARHLYPTARRGLLTAWGDNAARDAFFRASALGHVDYYVHKPAHVPDERFHRAVTDFLDEWWRLRGVGFEQFRIVDHTSSARARDLRQLLERNGHPFGFYDPDSADGRAILAGAGATTNRLPVLVMPDGQVLVDPTNAEIGEALGVTVRPPDTVFDVAIIGAGPAGLAAAVYAGSEGLSNVVIEPEALGGQAGTSSLIRNYLGFPRGISGAELTHQAADQALLFGTEFVYGSRAVSLRADGDLKIVGLSNATEVRARAIVIATGVAYRRLDVPALEALVGVGVFYGTGTSEARALTGAQVFIVGGGNSAGQAALHLAKYAEMVTLLVRSGSLAASMSDYLITALEAAPNVHIEYGVELAGGDGDGRLDRLELRDLLSGRTSTVPASALFVLIGADPHTEWLEDAVARDQWGYVLTGSDVPSDGGSRSVRPMETSVPGVFAVGDVRHGAVKRVASGVGEGSASIGFVHDFLACPAPRTFR